MKHLLAASLGALCIATAAPAATVFADNFDSYGPSTILNAPSSTFSPNWTVATPSVDYIAAGGSYSGLCLGTGSCVDLDGSSNSSGLFQTVMSFVAGTYTLTLELFGNGRGGSDDVTISLGDWSTTLFNIAFNADASGSFTFTTTTAGNLSFQNSGGDNVGAILSSVTLEDTAPVPLPAAGFLLLAALGALGLRRRMA